MLGMQATDLLSALTNNAGQTPLYTWPFSLELLSGKKIPVKELLSQNTSSDLFLSLCRTYSFTALLAMPYNLTMFGFYNFTFAYKFFLSLYIHPFN